MVLDAVTLVVVAFGETVGQNLGPGHSAQQVQETYALLFADAARLAAHRLACEDATPLVNNDGRCPLCGTWPTDHEDPTEGTDA